MPSINSRQRFSPETAGSQIASSDEAAARVQSRSQWRQEQAAEQQAAQEQGWTLRAISIGNRFSALLQMHCIAAIALHWIVCSDLLSYKLHAG